MFTLKLSKSNILIFVGKILQTKMSPSEPLKLAGGLNWS